MVPPLFRSVWHLDVAGGGILHRLEYADIVPHWDVGVLVELACSLGHGTYTHKRGHHQIAEGVDMPRRQMSGETRAARFHQSLEKVFKGNTAALEDELKTRVRLRHTLPIGAARSVRHRLDRVECELGDILAIIRVHVGNRLSQVNVA